MRIVTDRDRCQGAGQCVLHARRSSTNPAVGTVPGEQVTVPTASPQLPWVEVAEMNVVPAGS